jgi:hypothetical protein
VLEAAFILLEFSSPSRRIFIGSHSLPPPLWFAVSVLHLENIEKNKMRVAKYYNKKVKVKKFAEGYLVWKALLSIETKYSAFGKWSPNWEGPFRFVRCVPGNAYILKTLLGEEFTSAINGRYLKKYYLSIEIDR